VPSRRHVSRLYAALESFGRRGRRLDAARLETFPETLLALFGEDAMTDPNERRIAAGRVESALRRIIAAIEEPVDRRIAEAVFATEPEFYDKTVTERQEYVYSLDFGFTYEQFKIRRARIIGDVAASLQRALGTQGISKLDLLSAEARRAARQLYWFLQETLLYVESFAHAARIIDNLHVGGEYQDKARSVIASRSPHSDAALWAFAHCFEYLRTLERDDTGRDFLREHLPVMWWRRELNTPFVDYETAEIRATLAAAAVDEAYPFVEAVLRGSRGPSLHERWLQLLSAPPAKDDEEETTCGRFRKELVEALIAVVRILERVFPEETRPPAEVGEASDVIVWNLVLWGPVDKGLSFDDDEGHEVYRAIKAALQDGPALWTARYVFAEKEPEPC
jgi:hypothetical protein